LAHPKGFEPLASAFGGQRPEVSLPNFRSLMNDKTLILRIYEIILFPLVSRNYFWRVTPVLPRL